MLARESILVAFALLAVVHGKAAMPAATVAPAHKPYDHPGSGSQDPPATVVPLQPKNPYDIEGDDIDKGGDVTKACRYDDPPWSNCDPFELIRHKTLRLVSGGRQCEEVKNVTAKCTPYDLPPGTRWLIEEHRRAMEEFKRLKTMIADMAKYITTLREKGSHLFNAYLSLKKHMDEINNQYEELKKQNAESEKKIAELRKEVENWKEKARNLQAELDQIKQSFHDLQKEHRDGQEKVKECRLSVQRCKGEIERLKKVQHAKAAENTDLKRRLMAAEKYKDTLAELKLQCKEVQGKNEKLKDKLEEHQEKLSSCKIDVMSAINLAGQDDLSVKDTKMDLSMEMWITHNRSEYDYTYATYTTPEYTTTPYYEQAKCLISYYGVTNETCWYQSDIESIETEAEDVIGTHAVEAHWKYFTIDVQDQYECDRAASLHYEFLINRCKPKHYLPVLSVFRRSEQEQELPTHVYPKPNIPQPGQNNRCWITFLGPHGHCERRMEKYPLYNTDDTVEGYRHGGSGISKAKCLARAAVWSDYCETPCLATYLPDGATSNWHDNDIQHDNHGGRMFEEKPEVKKKIHPDSYNPSKPKPKPQESAEVFEDTPEYRKSLNMPEGPEKQALLQSARDRIAEENKGKKAGSQVSWHHAPKAEKAPAAAAMPEAQPEAPAQEQPQAAAPAEAPAY